jgi:hypothetical protein
LSPKPVAWLPWWRNVTEPLAAGFAKPFAEQMAALRLRLANQVGTVAWDDLVHAEHDRAFVVAGALKADLLADLGKAVERAIGGHRSLDKFRAEFRQIVTDRGWHGWTGEGTPKGEAWRTKVIYRTNMATSYAAGRMAQLVKLNYKFWVYKHGNALEPRLQHLAWDGVALPPDDPFWATHAPPNGWGCTCRITGADSAAGIKRAGGDPAKTLPDGWSAVSPKTGAPVGIDKGWDYKVGGSVADEIVAIQDKLQKLPKPLAVDLLQDQLGSDRFAKWFDQPSGNWPLVRIDQSDADLIGAKVNIAYLSPQGATKQKGRHPELRPDEYMLAQRVIDSATAKATEQDDKTNTWSRIFVQEVGSAETGGYVLVVKATLTGEGLFVTSFRRLSRIDALRDTEIKKLLQKDKGRTAMD